MVEITLPIILQILQTIGILVGIVYYITIMRNTQRTRELSLNAQEQALETRQAQMFLQMLNRWRDETEGLDVWPVIATKISNAEEYLDKYKNDEDFK